MKRYVLPAMLTAAMLSSSGGFAANYNTESAKTHGPWHSLYLHLGDDQRGRAVNTNRTEETLVIDMPIGACDTYAPQLQASLGEFATEDLTVETQNLRARVDRKPIHTLESFVTTERGDKTVYVEFSSTEPARLWSELRQGSTVRFQWTTEDGDSLYSSFSLNGSAAALARATAICERKSPSSYFEDDDRPSDSDDPPDSSYF